MHGIEPEIVLLACLVLVAGAATRFLLRGTRVPYTIALLLLGCAAGVLVRSLAGDAHGGVHPEGGPGHEGILQLLADGRVLTESLILYVFLPALVFESAFSLDTYSVRKELGAISLLAVPAMVVSTVLAAVMMKLLAGAIGWDWSWPAALVFGALISATDPVAVVALMREVGAPKRLGTLVEGESLFNDGTAIVLFGVLVTAVTGNGAQALSVGGTLLDFLVVVLGGIGVGLLLSFTTSLWLGRVFNDPMVEITLTLILAYGAMVVAEGLLGVSGVMAIVTAGLWMSSTGKTDVSPEVGHFLHEFWELLAYGANTMIFLLVGLVLGVTFSSAEGTDLLVAAGAFVGLVLLRFGVVFAFRPLMPLLGDGISPGQAIVMAWGGLRGAVSLALALAVQQRPDVPAELGEQILVVTAGVVLLTILVNGSTMGWVLARLGYTRKPPGEELAVVTTELDALQGVRRQLGDVRRSRVLPTAPWGSVETELEGRIEGLRQRADELREELASQPAAEAAGAWRQVLEIERDSYWDAFGRGILGPRAVRILSTELDVQVDRLQRGEVRPPSRRHHLPETWLRRLVRALARFAPWLGGRHRVERLELLYDLARAEVRAAREVLSTLRKKGDEIDADVAKDIRQTYERYLRGGMATLEDLRGNLPELIRAIEEKLARRVELNMEREAYRELARHGDLDTPAAGRLRAEVDARIVKLRHETSRVEPPSIGTLCRTTPLFAALDSDTIDALESVVTEVFLTPEEVLLREGEPGDAMFIVLRGVLRIVKETEQGEQFLDVAGAGEMVGEMALLTEQPRFATVVAHTSAHLARLSRSGFSDLAAAHPTLEDQVWRTYAANAFDNLVRLEPRFRELDHEARMAWLQRHDTLQLAEGESVPLDAHPRARTLFLIAGRLDDHHAPGLFEVNDELRATAPVASTPCRLVLLDRWRS